MLRSILIILTFAFVISLKAQENTDCETYVIVEQMPIFSDSTVSFFDYLKQNISYGGTENLMKFIVVVEKDGIISNVKFPKIDNELFCNNLKSVILNTSPWEAGRQTGRSVKVEVTYEILLPDFIKPSADYYLELGDSYFIIDNFKSANEYYHKALILRKNEEIYDKIGLNYFEFGKKYLIEKDTTQACIYFNMAFNKPYKIAKAKKYYRKYCDK